MSFLDSLFGSDDSSQKYLQQALAQYQNLNIPTVESESVNNLPQETVQGSITPEQEQAALQGDTEQGKIILDPAGRQAQQNALTGYQDIANAGGLDASAKLGIQQAVDAANVQSQGAQGALANQARAMGQGGTLFDLTQRAIAGQGASNNAATQGLQQAAMAEQSRQNALSNMASIGGNLESSDYGMAANKANAQDAINASNAATRNNASQFNIGNNMNAQGTNLQNAQNVNSSNTAANQNNAYYNSNLVQQQFNNQLNKAAGMAGINQSQANAAQTASSNQAAGMGQLLKGGLTLGATAFGGPAGGMLASGALSNGTPIGNAAGIGQVSTPKNSMQYKPVGYAEGGAVEEPHNHFLCMLGGGCVPGEAKIAGDSAQNDTVPAMLSPGENVIPRSKANNPEKAAKEAKRISVGEFTKGYKGKR